MFVSNIANQVVIAMWKPVILYYVSILDTICSNMHEGKETKIDCQKKERNTVVYECIKIDDYNEAP